jgi:predicted DNA binding CopG/RHH family protein
MSEEKRRRVRTEELLIKENKNVFTIDFLKRGTLFILIRLINNDINKEKSLSSFGGLHYITFSSHGLKNYMKATKNTLHVRYNTH